MGLAKTVTKAPERVQDRLMTNILLINNTGAP